MDNSVLIDKMKKWSALIADIRLTEELLDENSESDLFTVELDILETIEKLEKENIC